MKDTSIPLDKFFQIIKPSYVYIKITPHKSIRNYNSSNIAKSIALSWKSINKVIRIEQKKLWVECNFKVSYIIDIQEQNANFYFIVPTVFKNILLEKIAEIWSKCTVEETEAIQNISVNATKYQVYYKKEDALSLAVDKKSNEPLNSMLSVMDIMQDNDRVTICYNFHPTTQFGWQERYDKTLVTYKAKKPVDKDKMTFVYILKASLNFIVEMTDLVMDVFNEFLGGKPKKSNNVSFAESLATALESTKELSVETKKKKEQTILDTEILIASESKDRTREFNNIHSVCTSYRAIDGDNELQYKKFNNDVKLENQYWGCNKSQVSVDEAQNFIQIPGRSLLTQLGIKHINVEEAKVPKELQNGYISLGISKYKGNNQEAFIEDHRDIGSMPLFLTGRQGGGKTTYLCNYANYCSIRNESVVHIDYIKNCEASKSIEDTIKDKEKVIILDFSTKEGLQSLAYNEVEFTNKMTWFDKQQLANKKTELTIELVNSINENGEPLSPKMERYLCACTDIIYLNQDSTFKDVIRCLQDFRYRDKVIKSIPLELKEELKEEIQTLEELDEWSAAKKDTISEKIGTRESKIEGILDRVTLLKRDFYLKKMFNKSPGNNINFAKALEEGKIILVRMPQSKFKNYVKNVITTFLVTKCWLACELRGEIHKLPSRTHVLIDELSQAKTAERYIESILTQTRKFGLKFVICGQYLDQLDKKTIYSLKGAGTTFMLLKGSIKEDFEYFKDELDGTFEYEDLKDMEEYSSLNIVEYTKGKACFMTKLPKPL